MNTATVNPDIKISIRRCLKSNCSCWIVMHDWNYLGRSNHWPEAVSIADYWARSFKEYRP